MVTCPDSTTNSKYKCDECNDSGWSLTINNTYAKCDCVEKGRVTKLWEAYGVQPSKVKMIKDFMPYDDVTRLARDRSIDYIMKFKEIKNKENNWFLLMGQPGAGKSHLVISVGAALIRAGYNVIYMPYTEAVKELKGIANEYEYYTKLVNRYQRAEVLVIDDLFKDHIKNGKITTELTGTDLKHIFPILNNRYYNSLPTIVSSECLTEMFLDLDEALGRRILERSSEFRVAFRGEKYNYSVKKLEG